MIPTYQRPDLVRGCVLQWLVQTMQPHCICVHQNGSDPSYEWAVQDLHSLGRIDWVHTPYTLQQHKWYEIPLRRLLAEGCTHFFWADHDDLYMRDHVEKCVAELQTVDFTVASHCGLLYVRKDKYVWHPVVEFNAHAPGGMSSSMAFTRSFAQQLVEDLANDTITYYSDNVVAHVTKPKFSHTVSSRKTTVYVSHPGSLSSAHWLDGVLPEPASDKE